MSASRVAVTHLDPRAPFVVDTRELGRRAGSMRTVRRVVPAPEGWSLALVGVPAGSDVTLELRLEAVMEGVLVSGDAGVHYTGECGRCLTPVDGEVTAVFQELFGYAPRHDRHHVGEGDDDEPLALLDGDLIDLTDAVRDAVMLTLPLNPVCAEDCAGLCPDCGARLDLAGPEHQHDGAVDPRWAALTKLSDVADLTTDTGLTTDTDPTRTGS
jgi:uncharacterized protein